MTIVSACSNAAIRLLGRKITTVYSSTDTFELELSYLVQDVAVEIAEQHDWQALTKLAILAGDGVSDTLPLPDDYDRMLLKGDIHSSAWQNSYFTPARSLDQWLNEQTFSTYGAPGFWIILAGNLRIFPVIPADQNAQFYYISKNIGVDQAGVPKATLDADTDAFALDERLLTLGIIWRWRAMKGLEYAEDMQNFEVAVAREIARDRGSRVLTIGRPTFRGDVRYAYPGVLG